jgi:hypothetical protein
MRPADVSAFVTSLHRLGPKTVSRIVSDMRGFLQFLLLRGILQQDLSQVSPKIRLPRDATIPSVWHPGFVIRLRRSRMPLLTVGLHIRPNDYVESQRLVSFTIREPGLILHITTYCAQ